MRSLLPPLAMVAAAAALASCGQDEPACKASFEDVTADPAGVCTTDIDRDAGRCFEPPQICPSASPLAFCFQRVTLEYPPRSLLLTNYGEQPLVIESVELLGDTRCSYDLQMDPPPGTPIGSGEAAVLQMAYSPPDEGADQVRLRIRSNAENLPELVVFACGTGVPAGGDDDQPCGPRPDPEPDGFLCTGNDSEEVVTCG